MASVKSDISLQIKNNLNRTATFSILGGTQDPSNGQANAKTIYEWDLTAETFANTTVVRIEASTIDNPVIINYEVSNQDGAVTDLETVVRLLNTLNLGVFNLDGNTIWIIDDINVFGNIEVLVSLSFDINVFVQEAYNYFDPLGKTPFGDFQTRYTSVIQQAVDTIPDFVDFVESQGWSLCYLTNASEISIIRFSAGSFFYVTDIGGVLTTNEATSGTSITQAGLENTLLYTSDISIWTTLQEIEFRASLLPADDCYIFKFIFETTISTFFVDDPFINNAWIPLDSTYFVNAENQGILVELKPNTALDLYGSDFPNIVQPNDYDIIFRSINGRVELIPDGFGNEGLVFNEMSQDSKLQLIDIWASNTGVVNCDFSTLILNNPLGFSLAFSFYNDLALAQPQQIDFSVDFNNKFENSSLPPNNFYDRFTISGNGVAGANDPILRYLNTITELFFSFERVDFSKSVTENLPPIKQFGVLDALGNYKLRLTMDSQNFAPLGVGREMEYFNNWFYELGTQNFLSQNTASTTGGLGNLLFSVGNTFILSGQGYYGYQALIENGFTITTPVGAITPNVMTFTQKEGELLLVRTISAIGQSTFEVTSAEKNQAESVDSSSTFAIGTEVINFPAPALGEDNNAIFTADPTLDCTSFYIGTNPPFLSTECMTTFIVGNGEFNAGIDLTNFTLNGLTITLPLIGGLGDAYGLFQRDFSGLNGNNVSNQLTIRYFRINATEFDNPLVQPYGSNALFNIAVNGIIPSIPEISFQFCEFATDEDDTSASPSPLDLLLPVGARCQNGISFSNCTFNYTASTFGGEIGFNINNGAVLGVPTQTALLGTSIILDTTFGAFANDTIRLFTNYNGTGDTLADLTFQNNSDLLAVLLTNSSTAVPPPCSLTFTNNPLLNNIDFQDYNVNNFSVGTLPLVSNLLVNDNDLPSADLDSIIIALDNNGLSNGTFNYINQTSGSIPSLASQTAYNNLNSRGWFLIGNKPTATALGIKIGNYLTNSSYQKTLTTNSLYQFSTNGNNFIQYNGSNIEKSTVGKSFIPSTIGVVNQSVSKSSVGLTNSGRFRIVDNDNYLFALNTSTGTIQRFDFGTNLDLSTLSLSQTSSISFGTNGYFTFSNDGTNLFVFQSTLNPSDTIKQYTLSTAFDLTTLNITPTNSPSLSAMGVPNNFGGYFNLEIDTLGDVILIIQQTGTPVPFIDDISLYQIDLSTSLDITTASYSGSILNLSGNGLSLGVAPNLAFIYALRGSSVLQVFV